MSNKLNVFIVDDHDLFREGLRYLLTKSPIIGQVSEAGNGADFLRSLESEIPDAVLMDIEMPGMNGIETTKQAIAMYPELKVIALSMYGHESFYTDMIDAGAKGFLLKNSRFEDVIRAVEEVSSGHNYFSPEILDAIVRNMHTKKNHKIDADLSKREIEVLLNICKGLSNQEIADNLSISKRTVDKHRENILLKTGSKNTAELVVHAIKNQIFIV